MIYVSSTFLLFTKLYRALPNCTERPRSLGRIPANDCYDTESDDEGNDNPAIIKLILQMTSGIGA